MTADLEARWRAGRWRLIRGRPFAAPLNHALDEVLLRRGGAGTAPPTLRFWDRLLPEVAIGRFQSLRNEVDMAAAGRYGIRVVRRMTGGGAIFIEPANVITYSLTAPEVLVEGLSFVESYAFCDRWVIAALRSLGLDAAYQPINDISSSGGKIGGAAQARRYGGVLHHTTMSYDLNSDRMLEVLRIGREKLSDRGITSAAKRVTPLRQQTELPRSSIVERMVESFAAIVGGVDEEPLAEAELAEAEAMVETKYGRHEWTDLLP